MQGDKIKIYKLVRHTDVNGISGKGIVALIAQLPSGRCVMEWISSNHPTITLFANLQEIELIHGHGGATVVESVSDAREKRKKHVKK